MIILAIDPGNESSAFCVMDDNYQLFDFGKLDNSIMMAALLSWMDRHVDEVVIERVASYGMPVGREVFETCEWIGRFAQEAEKKTTVRYVFRKEEKWYICRDSRAKDANIRQALIDRFAKHDLKNGRGTKDNPDYFYGVKADIWAAIAVAVTWLDMKKEKELKKEETEKQMKIVNSNVYQVETDPLPF